MTERLCVHHGDGPAVLMPCSLSAGWAAFEAAVFASVGGLDAETQTLSELWLCTRDGAAEALVARDALCALRDRDHCLIRVAPRLALAEEEKAGPTTVSPAAALPAPPAPLPATPATAVIATQRPLAAPLAAAVREAPGEHATPPPPPAPSPPLVSADAAAATRGEAAAGSDAKRAAEGQSGAAKRARAAEPRAESDGGALAPPRVAEPSEEERRRERTELANPSSQHRLSAQPFAVGTLKAAVFTALQRGSGTGGLHLRDVEAATQELFDWSTMKKMERAAAFLSDVSRILSSDAVFMVSDGLVSLRAVGACGGCGDCGYCRRDAATSNAQQPQRQPQRPPKPPSQLPSQPPSQPLGDVRCNHCGSVRTALAHYHRHERYVSVVHRCKDCGRTSRVGHITKQEHRAAQAGREAAQRRRRRAGSVDSETSLDDLVEEDEDDEMEGEDTAEGEYTPAPAPSASAGVGAASEGRAVPPKKLAVPSLRAAAAIAPAEVAAPPAPPPLAVPDAYEDACEVPTVAPRLWIGAASAAANREWLRARGITHVVNVALEVHNFHPDELVYHNMRLRDTSDDVVPMMEGLPAAHAFIDAALASGGAVLVHCRMGLSRSAAVVAAYGMRRGVAQRDAIAALTQGRRGLSINFAFRAMLEMLQQKADGTTGLRHTRSAAH